MENVYANSMANNGLDPFENLANAIIIQAVEDYKEAKTCLATNKDSTGLLSKWRRTYYKNRVKELRKFFRSRWYSALSHPDGREILARIDAAS